MKENSGRSVSPAASRDKQSVTSQPSPQTPSAGSSEQPAGSSQPEAGSSKGMSSGAKWGIGLGACCCCLIIAFLIFIILGFAGCSAVRNFGGYNWPATPPLDEGTEIPIPSFSTTPR